MQPIRVLHIVGIMNMGGIENLLMNVYRKIDKEKVQFDFLVTREEDGVFDEEIRSLGGKIYNIPAMSKIGYVRYKKRIYRFLKQNYEYKIVHCHRDALCSIYLKQAKKAKIPVRIAHSHNTKLIEPNTIKGKINLLIKNYFKLFTNMYATEYFACGYEAGIWLYGAKIANQKVKIINNGIDTGEYKYNRAIAKEIRESLGIKDDTLVIGHVGRFELQKNHRFLIEIFMQIVKKVPESKLLLIGQGSLEPDIRKQVKIANLEEKVVFLGIRNDVNKLLMGMDVFVFPSLFEGLPVSLIETQASGIKSIISDTISKEVDLKYGLISRIPLNNINKWVEEIMSVSSANVESRELANSKIKQSEYEIMNTVSFLENFYINSGLEES